MSASTWILCLKIILISLGAISIAMTVKFSIPSIIDFAFYEIPAIWTTVVSWLKPPYIYFIVNGMIIIIAASSQFSFQKADNSENSPQSQPLIYGRTHSQAHIVAATIPKQTITEINCIEVPPPLEVDNYEEEDEISESNIVEKAVIVNGIIEADEIEKEAYDDIYVSSPPVTGDFVDDRDLLVSRSACSSPRKTFPPAAQLDYFPLPVENKPLLPSRFGHRNTVKAVPEGGRAPGVGKPKRHETLESTWNMIMEGRDQLNKSDRFDQNKCRNLDLDSKVSNHYENDDNLLLPQHVLKSATFRDRTNYVDALPPAQQAPGNWSSNLRKIKKELSIGQDELNRRVEAFIKKVNEDMRMQRQNSINNYMEMINRRDN